MSNFFDSTKEGAGIAAFGLAHIVILIVFAAGLVWIWISRHRLAAESNDKARPLGRILEVTCALLMLLQQASLYSWYAATGYHAPQEALPFYHCRITILVLATATLLRWRFVQSVAAIWGLVGAIASLAVMDTDTFDWPHLTLVSFVAGHALLGWLAALVIARGRAKLTVRAFAAAGAMAAIHMAVFGPLDFAMKANFTYITHSPVLNDFVLSLPVLPRGLAIVGAEVVFLLVSFVLLKLFAPAKAK